MKHNNVLVGAPLETIGSHHDVYGSVCVDVYYGRLGRGVGGGGGGWKVRREKGGEKDGGGIRRWERLWRKLGVLQEPLRLGCITS